jgi:hypothetical protein
MPRQFRDSEIDAIQIIPNAGEQARHRLVRLEAPPELLVVTSALGIFSHSELPYVASGVSDREGIGTNGTGFQYDTDELDPDEEPLEGVRVYNVLGEVDMSRGAFERLMTRYFRAIIENAQRTKHPIRKEPWWPEFVETVQKIEERTKLAESNRGFRS